MTAKSICGAEMHGRFKWCPITPTFSLGMREKLNPSPNAAIQLSLHVDQKSLVGRLRVRRAGKVLKFIRISDDIDGVNLVVRQLECDRLL